MAETKVAKGYVTAPFECWRCEKELADSATEGTRRKCPRCGAVNVAPSAEQAAAIRPLRQITRPSAQETAADTVDNVTAGDASSA